MGNQTVYLLLSSIVFLACSCSYSVKDHAISDQSTNSLSFEEYQMLRTVDSSLYVRISFLTINEIEKIWKLELGEYQDISFVAKDTFYGGAEWQGSQGGCYWWTFAETHIQNAISYREDPSTLYLPAGYDIFYPSYEGILSDDGKVELYPVVR